MAIRILLCLLYFAHWAQAEDLNQNKKNVRVPIAAAKNLRLTYGYPPWNKDPQKIDTATIILREGQTGRIVQINLEETAPDSSVFSGLYSLSWKNVEALAPEFYIPPQELLSDKVGMNKITTMIKNGELRRKAFILRKFKNNLQVVELYDTKDQAKLAMKAFRAEEELTDLRNRPLIADSAMDAGVLAEQVEEHKRAALSLIERARMQQIEAQKAAEAVRKFELLSTIEKRKRQALGADMAKEALAAYQSGNIPEAINKFEKAIELDPENKSFYFQYGISLYKAELFNRSLVMFDLADESSSDFKGRVDAIEIQYYVGLDTYRLKLFKDAASAFEKVVAAKHQQLSASAQFYIGVCYFEQQDYKNAQERFQAVLDSASDPKLDARAEQYIEQILRIQQFEKERSHKWNLTGTIGFMSDSNVIFASDTTIQNTPTNSAGERLLTVGSLRYRPLYEAKREFAAQLDVTNMYTTDSSFQYSQTLRNTDPFLVDLTLPYTIKGVFQGKGFKLDIVPGYETLYMSVENNTEKSILTSYLLNGLSTLVMSEDWFANYNLELRQDNASLTQSTGDDDQSAIKVKFTNSNLFFLNKEKNKILSAEAAYTHNNAVGKNSIYDRLDLGLGYVGSTFWSMMYNTKLSYYLLNYSANANARLDKDYTLSAGLNKKINENISSSVSANYNINSSNVDSYQYKKWMVLLTMTYDKAF